MAWTGQDLSRPPTRWAPRLLLVSLVSLPASDLAPLSWPPVTCRGHRGHSSLGEGLCPRTQHEADSRVRSDTLLREGWAPSSGGRATSPLSRPWWASEARPPGVADLACPRPPRGAQLPSLKTTALHACVPAGSPGARSTGLAGRDGPAGGSLRQRWHGAGWPWAWRAPRGRGLGRGGPT